MATTKISQWNEVTGMMAGDQKNPGMGFTNAIVYQNALHIRLNNYVYKWDDPKCKMYGWMYALHRRAPKAQNDKVTDFKTYYLVLYTAEKKMQGKKRKPAKSTKQPD